MEYLVPTKDEIDWLVRQLHNNFSRVPSGMRAEHHKGWLAEDRKEEYTAVKAAEGAVAAIGGPGGEDREGKR